MSLFDIDSVKILIPPLKIQGIKTKIYPHIKKYYSTWNKNGIYYEPFMGSGIVGFNLAPKKAIFSDNNPHIINFYNAIKNKIITKDSIKEFLYIQNKNLSQNGQEYYLNVRKSFNEKGSPFDFLFLNRSCFNGLMRFNSKGNFNVPYCKKDKRFSKSYITKIANQVDWVSQKISLNEWEFICCDFRKSLNNLKDNDFIYCDPPYIARHNDYFNRWNENDEIELSNILKQIKAKFILSTWHSNKFRENLYLEECWQNYNINLIEHFYHLGARESNRQSIKEALIF